MHSVWLEQRGHKKRTGQMDMIDLSTGMSKLSSTHTPNLFLSIFHQPVVKLYTYNQSLISIFFQQFLSILLENPVDSTSKTHPETIYLFPSSWKTPEIQVTLISYLKCHSIFFPSTLVLLESVHRATAVRVTFTTI